MEGRGTIADTSANSGVETATTPIRAPQTRRTAAIDVLTRALRSPTHGPEDTIAGGNANASQIANNEAAASAAARSFLDQTCSVYVLDADTASPPHTEGENRIKIFGCWNFLHQAMNEIERLEGERQRLLLLEQRQAAATGAAAVALPPHLLSETRLLAELAVKVARRSDDLDRQKVATCVENFCGRGNASASARDGLGADATKATSGDANRHFQDMAANRGLSSSSSTGNRSNTNDLIPEMVRANAEIREIVTGRIAAFSFNNKTSAPAGSLSSSPTSLSASASQSFSMSSALEDPLVVETFCKFLAANAVSNGPEKLRRFLNDWIIPGATVGDDTFTLVHDNNSSNTALQGIPIGTGNKPIDTTTKRQKLSPNTNRLLHHRLPPYSLACVLYHVAGESSTTSSTEASSEAAQAASPLVDANSRTASAVSPLGTIDVLQRLSLPVMANVLLGPVLRDGLKRTQLKRQLREYQWQSAAAGESGSSNAKAYDDDDDDDDAIVAMGLRAISTWCATTDLSLAQTKHIGSKVKINLSHLLGEALNTESPKVMSALADLIESVVERHVVPQTLSTSNLHKELISDARMTQTRYLMQVPDEISFRANVSQEQLHVIETKELSDILRELAADVERQRFRFPLFGGVRKPEKAKQQSNAPQVESMFDDCVHSLGHSLARIAAAVCSGYSKVMQGDISSRVPSTTPSLYQIPGAGFLQLLSKCASHPSVAICGIVLPIITPVLKTEVGLATEWLPTLQRRAIIPHHSKNSVILSSSSNIGRVKDNVYIPLLNASDVCFVEFEEFVDGFRDTVLADALNSCYMIHSEYYLASCTAAIEEFCVGDVTTEQTSFHLEAALFCLAAVSELVLPSVLVADKSSKPMGKVGKKTNFNASGYLLRCTAALAKKPKSLNNPLTMAQTCQFLRKYHKWFGSNQHPGILDIAADLILFILSQCATTFPDTALSKTIRKETGVTPYSEASKALRCLLSNNSNHFLSNKAIAALGAGWESTFAACNRGDKLLTLEDRKNTCIGICHVLAALPKEQQKTSLMALALASIACLETMTERANSITSVEEKKTLSSILDRASDEIIIVATTARAFTNAASAGPLGTGNGRVSLVEPSMTVLLRAWPTISILASKYSFHDSILDSLSVLFVECSPAGKFTDVSTIFLQDVCTLAKKLIESENVRQNNRFFSPVFDLVDALIQAHATVFEMITESKQADEPKNQKYTSSYSENAAKIYRCVETLMRETITVMTSQNLLGSAWATIEKQGNGQSAFETKRKPEYRPLDFCNVGLGPLFSVLRTCARLCPNFFFHIVDGAPDGNEGNYGYESTSNLSMMRTVLDSAVSSIVDSQSEISLQAIAFLETVATLVTQFRSNKLTGEYNLGLRTNILNALLGGMCGIFQPVVVPHACRLLLQIISTSNLSAGELKVLFLTSLGQDHFLLGFKAWGVVHESCHKRTNCNVSPASAEEMERMMTEMWQLHRFENIDAIERSDDVHAFCRKFDPKKNSK